MIIIGTNVLAAFVDYTLVVFVF